MGTGRSGGRMFATCPTLVVIWRHRHHCHRRRRIRRRASRCLRMACRPQVLGLAPDSLASD